MRIEKLSVLLMMLTIAVVTFPAFGNLGYNTVLSSSEPGHASILSDVYGGTFTASGLDFTNGTVTAYRVYDFDNTEERIHIVNGNQNDIDKVWTDGIATVTAEAKYAALGQSFGWNQGGTTGTSYQELLNQGDIGGSPVQIDITGDFLWGIQPNGDVWWSKDFPGNDNGADHLCTYFIDGASVSGETVWMLFWEDLPESSWDQDYQDFVIEVRATPEPTTICLLGLGALALLRKRRA